MQVSEYQHFLGIIMVAELSTGLGLSLNPELALTRACTTEVGRFFTGTEAANLAAGFASGLTLSQALAEIHPTRRTQARSILTNAKLGTRALDQTLAVLEAIAGAHSVPRTVTPVWTMPGTQAKFGRLTSQVITMVDQAKISIVCASYNFAKASPIWGSLKRAANRPGVSITLYLDGGINKTLAVLDHLPQAAIYRTTNVPGMKRKFVSHAKFLIVDHRLVFITSANFSWQAARSNVELGLLVDDPQLAASIENLMHEQHGELYELLKPEPQD